MMMVRLLRAVIFEGIETVGPASEPPKARLDDAVVAKVPLPTVNSPFIVSVLAPTESVPLVSAKVPATVIDEPIVTVALALLMVRLFRAATLEGIESEDAVPPKVRLVYVDVVCRLALVPAIVGPFKVSVRKSVLPTKNNPEVRVRVPFTVAFASSITPPELLTVRLFNTEADDGNSFPTTTAVVPV